MKVFPFDRLVQSLAEAPSRRSLLAQALIGLAIPSALTRPALQEAEARKGGKAKRTVTICRGGLTLTVSKKALKKQLRQGASLGACPEPETPSPPSSPPSSPPVCTPDCAGRFCGSDGCGDVCGECDVDQVCNNGSCCTPDCDGRTCGDDGCGGICGTCGVNQICTNGRCQLACPAGQAPCFNVCIPASCQSQCNEPCRVIGSSCCGPLSCQRAQTGQVSCRP